MSGAQPFFLMITLSAVAAIVVPFGRRGAPSTSDMPKAALWAVTRRAPRLMAPALMMGIAQGSAMGLMAFYGVHAGLDQGQAVWMQATFLAGGVLLQGPIGWAVDRYDRPRLLAILAMASASSSILVHLIIHTTAPLYTLLFLGGVLTFGVYTVALALLGSRFKADGMAAANAAFILLWELGTLSGSPLSGGAIEVVGAIGLPLVMAGAMVIVVVIALWPTRSLATHLGTDGV